MKTSASKRPLAAPRPEAPAKSLFREYGEALGIAILLALLIRAFLFEAFVIPSGSMENTLLVGDYLLVNRFSYGIRVPDIDIFGFHVPIPDANKILIKTGTPKRGDIVVFIHTLDTRKTYIVQPASSPYRNNPYYLEPKDYIKRVIGLPGEKVQVIDKKVFINGKELKIPQVVFKERGEHDEFIPGDESPRDNFGPVVVPPHCYFVMGDNRDYSFDSRFWGFVSQDALKGKAELIYFSWGGPKTHGEPPKFFQDLMGGLKGLVFHGSWDTCQFRVRWARLGKIIH